MLGEVSVLFPQFRFIDVHVCLLRTCGYMQRPDCDLGYFEVGGKGDCEDPISGTL